jgi:hypothetical protein
MKKEQEINRKFRELVVSQKMRDMKFQKYLYDEFNKK